MLQHIKQLKEVKSISEVNNYLKKHWVLLKIVDTGSNLLYLIGLPKLFKGE